jgi:hypothetical protein
MAALFLLTTEIPCGRRPARLAPRLRGTQLFVAVGSGQPGPLDPAGTAASTIESSLAAENAALAQRLRALKIPAQFDFYGRARTTGRTGNGICTKPGRCSSTHSARAEQAQR